MKKEKDFCMINNNLQVIECQGVIQISELTPQGLNVQSFDVADLTKEQLIALRSAPECKILKSKND